MPEPGMGGSGTDGGHGGAGMGGGGSSSGGGGGDFDSGLPSTHGVPGTQADNQSAENDALGGGGGEGGAGANLAPGILGFIASLLGLPPAAGVQLGELMAEHGISPGEISGNDGGGAGGSGATLEDLLSGALGGTRGGSIMDAAQLQSDAITQSTEQYLENLNAIIPQVQDILAGAGINLQGYQDLGASALPELQEGQSILGYNNRLARIMDSSHFDTLADARRSEINRHLGSAGLTRSGAGLREIAAVPADLAMDIENRLYGRSGSNASIGFNAAGIVYISAINYSWIELLKSVAHHVIHQSRRILQAVRLHEAASKFIARFLNFLLF